jgi:hypothetical protein
MELEAHSCRVERRIPDGTGRRETAGRKRAVENGKAVKEKERTMGGTSIPVCHVQ